MNDCENDPKIMGPIKAIPEGWNCWDRIEIKGPKTCGELIDHLKKTYDVNVDMLTADGETIISTFLYDCVIKKSKQLFKKSSEL